MLSMTRVRGGWCSTLVERSKTDSKYARTVSEALAERIESDC